VQRHAFSLGVVCDLVAGELTGGEIAAVGVLEIEPADRGGGNYGLGSVSQMPVLRPASNAC
jgi:hypothetical protein